MNWPVSASLPTVEPVLFLPDCFSPILSLSTPELGQLFLEQLQAHSSHQPLSPSWSPPWAVAFLPLDCPPRATWSEVSGLENRIARGFIL